MSLEFKPPEPINVNVNLAEKWRLWSQRLTLWLTATEANDKQDTINIAMIIGIEALDRYNQFTYGPRKTTLTMA